MNEFNLPNDARWELRCPSKLKETLINHCKKHNRDASAFVREAIVEKLNRELSDTDMNPSADRIRLNHAHNLMLAYSKDLNKEYLKRMKEEVFNEN